MMEFFNKHRSLCYLTVLILMCIVFLFLGLGSFPLIDVDETRYATMARDMVLTGDWNDLILNGVPFLEKPPLYFWLVASSVKLFGAFTPFVVRFPIALMSMLLVILTYFLGKRVLNEKFGFYSASVLLSSFFFLMLSHIAILDSLLMVFIALALYSGYMATICEEKYKKYFWIGFYLALGVGVLDKGILAVGIPVVIMFLYLFITKNLKQLLNPIHILGAVIFFAIVTPWHYLMHKNYGAFFWIEYFVRHHFARFLNSETIGRERPFLYFVPVFIAGFIPWTLLAFDMLIDGIKKFFKKTLKIETEVEKLMLLSVLSFGFMFLLFSVASTKLPTYILPVFPFASILMGYYWNSADEKGEHLKPLEILSLTLAFVFVIAAISGVVISLMLPYNITLYFKNFQVFLLVGLSMCGMLLALKAKSKNIMSLFSTYLIIMVFVTMSAVVKVTNVIYMTGENELVNYSSLSSSLQNSKLITFDFAVKPSVKINNPQYIDFITDTEFQRLDRLLNLYNNNKVFVIVKNKNIKDDFEYALNIEKRLDLINRGNKYSLYVKP